jgi:hypothetical protein
MADPKVIEILREIRTVHLGIVRETIEAGREVIPVVFLVNPDGQIGMYAVLFRTTEERLELRALMRLVAAQQKAVGMAWFADLWHRRMEPGETRTHGDLADDPKREEAAFTMTCEWDPWNNKAPEILPYRRVG